MKLSTWIVLAVAAGGAAIAARKALQPDAEKLGRNLSERCDDLSRQLQLRLGERQTA